MSCHCDSRFLRRIRTVVLAFSVTLSYVFADRPAEGGSYIWLERFDAKRVRMRLPSNSTIPPIEEEIMLDQIEQWKWRVEAVAADAVMLVTFSQCPHGLGFLPDTLGWTGGGRWHIWPGTFEYIKGSLGSAGIKAEYNAISEKHACETDPDIKQLGGAITSFQSLQECQDACTQHSKCQAIDFYHNTHYCFLYDKACSKPTKGHDGASSWKLVLKTREKGGKSLIHEETLSFLAAKSWCSTSDACKGFSYSGSWTDQEKNAGIPRNVYFYSVAKILAGSGGYSYIFKENPRAQCNPEGRDFDCPANPYACLGLSIDSDDNSIKQAYRILSKRYHPDKLKKSDRTPEGVKQAEANFRNIADSNDILRDAGKRHEVDNRLKAARRRWDQEQQSVQDIYIKEPHVISLEPEMYPNLLPHGQEWLVHFFLPQNKDCKQMKVALARAATTVGVGLSDTGLQVSQQQTHLGFMKGDIYRGAWRERSIGLRSDGAGMRDGDVHISLVVQKTGKSATLLGLGAEITLSISSPSSSDKRRPAFRFEDESRVYDGRFDEKLVFRGTVAEQSNPKQPIASFALNFDTFVAPSSNVSTGLRRKPRLFGAVNCGRFPDFCKRKGADPSIERRFPLVRMIFPEEVRFEVYGGRPIGQELMAFAAEASRPRTAVEEINKTALTLMEKEKTQSWLILLHKEPSSSKAALDCALCKTAFPMLMRTAAHLVSAGIRVGRANCTANQEMCDRLGATEDDSSSEWGAFRLVEIGLGSKINSVPLWDTQLLPPNEISRAGLLVALEAAASTATLLLSKKRSEKTANKEEL